MSASESPIRVTEWILIFLILAIPVINLIMLFIWAFSEGEKASKRSFSRAILLTWALFILVYGFFALTIGLPILW